MKSGAIPTFYLYGEPHQASKEGFVHVEPLEYRSRPSKWTIRPHAHADLHQCLLIEGPGGTMMVDDERHRFQTPVLMIIPAGMVHGFNWQPESSGWVLTLSRRFLTRLCDRHPDIGTLFDSARLLRPDAATTASVKSTMATLRRELGWTAKGHSAAVEASLLNILVACLRSAHAQDVLTRGSAPSPAASLVARYRARLEDRFHLRERIADHAEALGASESALRSACARIAGKSPSAMLDDRSMLEARRMLLYSNMNIAAISYSLGFDDPAYFSRFFRRNAGASPARFRKGGGADETGGARASRSVPGG